MSAVFTVYRQLLTLDSAIDIWLQSLQVDRNIKDFFPSVVVTIVKTNLYVKKNFQGRNQYQIGPEV